MTRDELVGELSAEFIVQGLVPGATTIKLGEAALQVFEDANLGLIDTSPEGVERMADAAFPMEFVPGMDRNIVLHAIRAALEAGKVK